MGAWSYRIQQWPALARIAHYSSQNLAYLCGISQRQLQRHFQQIYKLKLQAWLNDVRLSDSRHFLDGRRPLKEVAFLLGFKTTNHFSREFKRKYGIAPGKFRVSNFSINPQYETECLPILKTPFSDFIQAA